MSSSILKRLVGVLAALALAVGISTVTAGPAEAASKTVWDRVAACESGGRWKINTGNGYYGGLQFSPSTWRGYGGKKYASQANRASKAEQIAVARRVLAGQGPGAWPVCSRKAGLTKQNGKANRNATPASNPGATAAKKSSSAASSKSAVSKAKSAVKKSTKKSSATYITVRSGDTLAKLARRHQIKGGWKALWKLNKSRLKNPHVLRIGQRIKIKK